MKKGFCSIFKNEVIRLFTTPRLLFLIVGFPMLLFFFYAALMAKGVPHDMPITLLDYDKSKLSRQLALMIESSSTMKIEYEVSDELAGQKTIRRGDSFAFIVIPKDFQKNAAKGLETNVTCYYNSQYLLPSGLIQRDFQIIAGTLAAGVRVMSLTQSGQGPQQALGSVMPVNTDTHVLFNPYTSYSFYLNLALMPMAFQIIIMVVSIFVFGSVLKYNKGKELLEQANDKIYVAILGKILPYTCMFFLIGFFMNTFLFYKIGVPLKGSFVGVNSIFFVFVLVCQSMALFLTTLFTSMRTALTIGGSYAALAFSFAGYTFPPEGMSPFIQGLNYIFPFHAYLRFLVNYGIRGVSYNTEQRGYLISFAVFVIIGLICIPFYYQKLKKGGYSVKK